MILAVMHKVLLVDHILCRHDIQEKNDKNTIRVYALKHLDLITCKLGYGIDLEHRSFKTTYSNRRYVLWTFRLSEYVQIT